MSMYQTELERRDHTQPEREDELGTGHEELGGEALEERGRALSLDHVADNPEAALWVLKVAVLDTRLDDVERGRDD